MKFLKYLMPAAAAFTLCAASLHGSACNDASSFDDENNEKDWYVLQDYMNTKRTIDVAEKSCNLTISGDVRTEWRYMHEKQLGQNLRGGKATNAWDYNTNKTIPGVGTPVPNSDWDIEFNLWFEYVVKNAWAVANVRFDNSAGTDPSDQSCSPNQVLIGYNPVTGAPVFDPATLATPTTKPGDPRGYHGSGRGCDLSVKAAYMGYNILSCGGQRLDIELGRRGNMYRVFDSQVQFLQRLDGVLLTYSDEYDWTNFYAKAAVFVIDEKVNHFGSVAETGFVDIMEYGVDLKYSIIDCRKWGQNRCFEQDPIGMQYFNSQWTAYYNFDPCWTWGKDTNIYGAFLLNHSAVPVQIPDPDFVPNPLTPNQLIPAVDGPRSNIAWYVGLEFGEIDKAGDWAFRTQYEWVQAHAMPDMDVAGIGRGNLLNNSVTSSVQRGNTNYKGWRAEVLYALTDNLTVDIQYESSNQIDERVGGQHSFRKFEIETIYAF
jgi:hypothetical protein